MKADLTITEDDSLATNMRTWVRPTAEGMFGDHVPTPTVFIHVNGRSYGGQQDDGYGPRVACEDALIRIELAKAIELRDQLAAVIAEYEQAAAPAAV